MVAAISAHDLKQFISLGYPGMIGAIRILRRYPPRIISSNINIVDLVSSGFIVLSLCKKWYIATKKVANKAA